MSDSAPSKPASLDRPVAGWREWVALPDLHVPWLKAKLDTGARTSSLHAFDLDEFSKGGDDWVRFGVRPWQRSESDDRQVELPVHDRRAVRSSSGHTSDRIVVLTTVHLVGRPVSCEMTLSNRDEMGFRMLIGREAMRGTLLVDPGRSYVGGRPPRELRRRNRGA